MTMAITDSEHVCVGTLREIWMQDKTVLILFAWITWHVPDPGCEGILSHYVLFNLLSVLAY
jgi:hypothetical protein